MWSLFPAGQVVLNKHLSLWCRKGCFDGNLPTETKIMIILFSRCTVSYWLKHNLSPYRHWAQQGFSSTVAGGCLAGVAANICRYIHKQICLADSQERWSWIIPRTLKKLIIVARTKWFIIWLEHLHKTKTAKFFTCNHPTCHQRCSLRTYLRVWTAAIASAG